MTLENTPFECLKKELQREIQQHRNAARFKGIMAHLLFWVVIAASSGSLVYSVVTKPDTRILSILGIIPGIALAITNTFKYEARAKWNKLKQRKLEGLCRRLVYENGVVSDISKELTLILEELDKERVGLEKPATSGK